MPSLGSSGCSLPETGHIFHWAMCIIINSHTRLILERKKAAGDDDDNDECTHLFLLGSIIVLHQLHFNYVSSD